MSRSAAFAALFMVAPLAFAVAPSLAAEMALVPGFSDVKYEPGPPDLPKGVLLAVIHGDPSKPGPFALRLKFPARTVVAPHTHSADETLTIFSGVLTHQMGAKLDLAGGDSVGPGGFVFLPGNMPHSVWTTDEPVELQVTGTGPFGLNYVNPADDPRRTR